MQELEYMNVEGNEQTASVIDKSIWQPILH